MMISELLAVVYESAAQTGKPLDPPLLLVLDEAANIAPIPNLDEIASTGAGQGVQLALGLSGPRPGQRPLRRARPDDRQQPPRQALRRSGICDPETLRYISQIVGQGEFRQRSETAGRKGYDSSTERTMYRNLAPANVVRSAEPGSALLVYGHLPPVRLSLRPWFNEPTLRELAGGRGVTGERSWRDDAVALGGRASESEPARSDSPRRDAPKGKRSMPALRAIIACGACLVVGGAV